MGTRKFHQYYPDIFDHFSSNMMLSYLGRPARRSLFPSSTAWMLRYHVKSKAQYPFPYDPSARRFSRSISYVSIHSRTAHPSTTTFAASISSCHLASNFNSLKIGHKSLPRVFRSYLHLSLNFPKNLHLTLIFACSNYAQSTICRRDDRLERDDPTCELDQYENLKELRWR